MRIIKDKTRQNFGSILKDEQTACNTAKNITWRYIDMASQDHLSALIAFDMTKVS